MEDVGVPKGFSPSLSGQSVQYFLPIWVVMKQMFSRGSAAHHKGVHDTLK